jgi:ATP-binding cassette, subfamily G (WHITE), member 2, PDR
MYRVNPFTYLVEGFLGTSLANAGVHCAPNEFITFYAPNGSTCGEYLSTYSSTYGTGGYLLEESATGNAQCQWCPISSTNQFLSGVNIFFDNRWRDFGLLWVFCVFNIGATFLLYWVSRVPKNTKAKVE